MIKSVRKKFKKKLIVPDKSECPEERGVIEITDNYADENGIWWHLCDLQTDYSFATSSLAITSYLNTLYIRQKNFKRGTRLNATVRVKKGEREIIINCGNMKPTMIKFFPFQIPIIR